MPCLSCVPCLSFTDGSHGDAHPPKAKSTLLSLQDLFGDDPPVAKGEEKSTALKDVPETMPSRDEQAKAVSGNLYKKLSTIKSEKDVEDIRLQTMAPRSQCSPQTSHIEKIVLFFDTLDCHTTEFLSHFEMLCDQQKSSLT